MDSRTSRCTRLRRHYAKQRAKAHQPQQVNFGVSRTESKQMSDIAPTPPSVRPPAWAELPVATRCLLIAVYFAEGVGLASLASFFAEAGWPVRIGIAAACLAPGGLLYFAWPHLRSYLPGPLLATFGLFIGMLPGVIAEQVAEAASAVPIVSKGLFVVVTAGGMAVVIWLTFRHPRAAGGPSGVGTRG